MNQISDSGNPIVSLRHISMDFYRKVGLREQQRLQVLNDVSFDIQRGEVLALVGESGGGKTTIGNIIAGLLQPTGGNLLFDGLDISQMSKSQWKAYRQGVQIVQQDSYAALNPARTIFQSLAPPILRKKIVRNKRQAFEHIRELLELVELKPFDQIIDKYPHQLSGGQRQRVLLARAISLSPQLIFADEPVSMIDVSLRISVLNLMSKLNRENGIAFLYVTHDLATARYIGREGTIGVLYLGELVTFGPVRDVIDRPLHPYLQALLAAVPVPDPHIAKAKRKVLIKDVEIPDIRSLPSGCRFHPRCIYADDRCKAEKPELRRIGAIRVACHYAETLPPFSLFEHEGQEHAR